MNYGDTGFPWDPNTLPQVCVSPSSPQSTLGSSSSPGSVRGRRRQCPRRSCQVCPGCGPREERRAGSAELCNRDWFSFPHVAVKIRPCKNFSFSPSPVAGKPRLGCRLGCPWGSVSSRLLLPAALYSAWYQSVSFLAVQNLQLGSRNFLKWESFLIRIISPFCVDY